MTDKPKCKGEARNPDGTWGNWRKGCSRNAGPSGYCHQHTEPDPSLGVLHSLRYDGYSDNAADAFTSEDVPILTRTAKVYRVKACRATSYKDTIALGDGMNVPVADDWGIVVIGTDKSAVREHMRALLVSRYEVARRSMARLDAARDALDQQEDKP